MGVSVDSAFSHANWGAKDCGGTSFPLLADFHPKGAMADSFGHYLADAGITDRATVIIDKSGTIRFSESVTPGGERKIDELAAECEKINAEQPAGSLPSGSSVDGATLFVKSSCGASRKALLAIDNLKLGGGITVANVSDDASAKSKLVELGGKDQAPCLILDGKPIYEASEIASTLANRVAPV